MYACVMCVIRRTVDKKHIPVADSDKTALLSRHQHTDPRVRSTTVAAAAAAHRQSERSIGCIQTICRPRLAILECVYLRCVDHAGSPCSVLQRQ